MSSAEVVMRRRKEFWRILEGQIGKGGVPFAELIDVVKKLENRSSFSTQSCISTLRNMRDEGRDKRLALTIGRERVSIRRITADEVGERREQRPLAKNLLGAFCWQILFGATAGQKLPYRTVQWAMIKPRLVQLRKQPLLSIVADAGSTIEAVVDQLDQCFPSMPFLVPESADPPPSTPKPLRIHRLITNSFIAVQKVRSSRHVEDIDLVFVGGQVRSGHACTAGMLSQACLQTYALAANVCLIGATGYRPMSAGGPSWLCNSLEESFLKAAYLEMSSLRVLVVDSSKLITRDVSRVFAPLAQTHLVITDDGCSDAADDGSQSGQKPEELAAGVEVFCKEAEESGVAVAVLESPRPAKPKDT